MWKKKVEERREREKGGEVARKGGACIKEKLTQSLSVHVVNLASSAGSLAYSRGGRGAKRESLVHIVCACANYLGYHVCMRYPRKYTEVRCVQKY